MKAIATWFERFGNSLLALAAGSFSPLLLAQQGGMRSGMQGGCGMTDHMRGGI